MAANFRICPECSTRNRLDKEYCVKCGESLEDVKTGDQTEKKGPGFFVSDQGDEAASPIVPLILVLLILALGLAAWRVFQGASLSTDAAVAAPPPQAQPSVPAAVVIAAAPGVQEYAAGMAALRAGDFPTALRLLREAVAAADKLDYRLGLAEALEKSGSTTEALAEYEAVAGLDPGNVRYTAEWAKALNRAGRNTEAISAYEVALGIDADNLANIREVANLHLRGNNFAGARPYLETIVRLQPNDLAPKQNLARALEAARDYEGAITQYQDILTAMPSADLTRALLSDTMMKQNRPDDALQVLDTGIQLDPDSAILYREKGRIMDRQRRNLEAVAAYREYVRLSPAANDIRVFSARIEQLSAMAGL